MAKFTVGKGLAEYESRIAALGIHAEGICKAAVYEGAGIIAEAIRDNTPVDTGDLRASVGIAPIRNDNGFINTKIGFDGYDRRGVPNAIKARVIESGSSHRRKKPFIRPAVERNAALAEFEMERTMTAMIDEIMKGK